MQIWANNIKNLTDGRYFAAYNAAWISFCFDPSSIHYIAPNIAAGIAGWLDGPEIAGCFGEQQSAADIENIAKTLNLQAVILKTTHNRREWPQVPLFFEIAANTPNFNENYLGQLLEEHRIARGFIVDFSEISGGWSELYADKKAYLNTLKQATSQALIYLKCHVSAADLPTIQAELPFLQGILIQGGEEEAVGVKNFDDLDELMDCFE
jgi:hypothetical protein